MLNNKKRTNKFYKENEKFLDFKDVLILPKMSKINSRSLVNLERTFLFNNNMQWTGIPIMCANMTTTGTLDVYKILSKYKILTILHKFHSLNDLFKYNEENIEKLNPNYFGISTGISDNDYNNLVNILDNFNCNFICIDIANGYISKFCDFCKKIRNKYTNKIIIAGNVCTQEGVEMLINNNIDIIKVGIGSGASCTTRIQTGIGMPQFSCIRECVQQKNNMPIDINNMPINMPINNNKYYILSDGGITCPGDLGKAFGIGADFIMIGGEFAGHDENPGKLIEDDTGKKYKFFYGMSSSYAMENNYAANNNKEYRSSEGREIKIKYRGSLENTVKNYLGGLRSTCTYTNTTNLCDLETNCNFILVNNQYNNNLL
jgi:GMP reductase